MVNDKNIKKVDNSTLENNGIIFETKKTVDEPEIDSDVHKEDYDQKFKEKIDLENKIINTVKNELSKDGIDLLPTNPTGEDNI